MGGIFIHTLVATDVCYGWTECIPLISREQSLVKTSLMLKVKSLILFIYYIKYVIDKQHWQHYLQTNPDTNAKNIFQGLQENYPGKFKDGQLRTLQRRVKEWRQIMSKDLVYSYLDTEH